MSHLIDKSRTRFAFERAAPTYDAAAVLQKEVGTRLMARLDYMKPAPAVILDAGAGTGSIARQLSDRYPNSRVIALDLAWAMLERARASGAELVRADIEKLPFSPGSLSMIFSNLVLQWSNVPAEVFREARRALRPGGLFLFSTFGPDTLRELRAAWEDAHTHVSSFFDMHDLGDLLVASGFDDPVMECERVTMTYAEVADLMHDLKAIGARNATEGRAHGLTGKAAMQRVIENYERLRSGGKLPATFEVIYAHAWKPEARTTANGRGIVTMKKI